MISNYHYLKKLSPELRGRLVGKQLVCCFSQEKDELVLGFADAQDSFWIKSVLKNNLNTLVFPEDFARTRGHSIDLFGQVIGLVVSDVVQHLNERAFSILFLNGGRLIFKMYGNRANILWAINGKVAQVFHQKFKQDYDLAPTELDPPLHHSFQAFASEGLGKTFPTLGKELKQELMAQGFAEASTQEQYEQLQRLLEEMEKPDSYVCRQGDQVLLMPLAVGEVLFKSASPVAAANRWFQLYGKDFFLHQERQLALKKLERQVKQTESYLLKTKKKLIDLQENSRHEEIANIIMANLHNIPPNMAELELLDFYNNVPLKVKVNPLLSPQKNAENYYRKAKNQKVEIVQLQKNLHQKTAELAYFIETGERLQAVEQVKDLRKLLKAEKMESSGGQVQKPFKEFEIEGFKVLVGKNAKSNDALLQAQANKDDLWLHARDVSGSHVILKYESKRPFPATVIEKAASLAAYYSQGKNDTLCAVMYAPKKFVQRIKGAAAGKVKVQKEKVLLVEPMAFE